MSADEQKLFIGVLGPSTLESVSCTKAETYLCQNQHGSHHLFYKSFVSKPLKDTSKAFFLLFQPLADEARGYISAGQWWIDVNNITNTRYLDNQLVSQLSYFDCCSQQCIFCIFLLNKNKTNFFFAKKNIAWFLTVVPQQQMKPSSVM